MNACDAIMNARRHRHFDWDKKQTTGYPSLLEEKGSDFAREKCSFTGENGDVPLCWFGIIV